MEVIPAINCEDFECVKQRVTRATSFLPAECWLHLDVADARFTFNKTWGSPEELRILLASGPQFYPEVHLMIEEPEKSVEEWLKAGAKRLVVHVEAIADAAVVESILGLCVAYDAELMLSSVPETPPEELALYFGKVTQYQILGVNPGLAGQNFLPLALEKVRFVRQKLPGAMIEVDGGVTEEIAQMAKDAGADIVVSASYIFDAAEPAQAYKTLASVG